MPRYILENFALADLIAKTRRRESQRRALMKASGRCIIEKPKKQRERISSRKLGAFM